jgi:hypothetical protein
MGSLTVNLYRTLLKSSRLCDANHGLRRHVISRLVRQQIQIGTFESQQEVAQLPDDYSLLTDTALTFRQHLQLQNDQTTPGQGIDNEVVVDSLQGVELSFAALKVYSAALNNLQSYVTIKSWLKQRPQMPRCYGVVGLSDAAATKAMITMESKEAEMEIEEQEVLAANAEFYAAIDSGDMERMQQAWHQDIASTCVHASRTIVNGWDEIEESWQQIFEADAARGLTVVPSHVRVQLSPPTGEAFAAIVTTTETIQKAADASDDGSRGALADTTSPPKMHSTNIFLRHNRRWLLHHRHASHVLVQDSSEQKAGVVVGARLPIAFGI